MTLQMTLPAAREPGADLFFKLAFAIGVTVAASTLMGLDDQPGELDGYGPITAAMARRIAADPSATWRRLLTDDHGHVRSASSKTYRPPPDMVRTVIARDSHCQYPGCRRTANQT